MVNKYNMQLFYVPRNDIVINLFRHCEKDFAFNNVIYTQIHEFAISLLLGKNLLV